MTTLEVRYRFGATPTEAAIRAMDNVREVYGVRRIQIQAEARTIRVEYDASRLSDAVIVNLLRNAGVDIQEKLTLA
jgi:hypothetical protein